MAVLPQQLDLKAMQQRWASILQPVVNSDIGKGLLLENLEIEIGANIVNHRLGRKLRGWIIVSIDGIANIYDTQASNQTPDLTLLLTSDAVVTVTMWVF